MANCCAAWAGISRARPVFACIWAPKGTPADIVSTLSKAVMSALAEPAVRQRFAELGQEIPPPDKQGSAALRDHQAAEVEKWWPIVKSANIKAE